MIVLLKQNFGLKQLYEIGPGAYTNAMYVDQRYSQRIIRRGWVKLNSFPKTEFGRQVHDKFEGSMIEAYIAHDAINMTFMNLSIISMHGWLNDPMIFCISIRTFIKKKVVDANYKFPEYCKLYVTLKVQVGVNG